MDSVMSKQTYPFLNARKAKPRAFDQYYEEPKTLGEEGINALLDKGKKYAKKLANTLNAGGAAVFPHTFLSQCGYQIAAAVHAILDSGADQALVLGVVHPMTESLMQARSKELNEEDISTEISRGVFGPGLDPNNCLKNEFSLDLFKILFELEVKRRGIKPPKLIERYPSLVNREPANLPGIKELEQISKDTVIIATDDMCHHGIGYGVSDENAVHIDDEGYRFARKYLEDGYALLKKDNYRGYFSHWMNPLAIGDPTDTTIVLKYLLGDVSPYILDLKLVDVSMLFENDVSPSWVAATLVEFKK
jgi:hypothetical protein